MVIYEIRNYSYIASSIHLFIHSCRHPLVDSFIYSYITWGNSIYQFINTSFIYLINSFIHLSVSGKFPPCEFPLGEFPLCELPLILFYKPFLPGDFELESRWRPLSLCIVSTDRLFAVAILKIFLSSSASIFGLVWMVAFASRLLFELNFVTSLLQHLWSRVCMLFNRLNKFFKNRQPYYGVALHCTSFWRRIHSQILTSFDNIFQNTQMYPFPINLRCIFSAVVNSMIR